MHTKSTAPKYVNKLFIVQHHKFNSKNETAKEEAEEDRKKSYIL